MVRLQEIFKTFYLGKHSGRKLQWQSTLGHCVLKAEFKEVDNWFLPLLRVYSVNSIKWSFSPLWKRAKRSCRCLFSRRWCCWCLTKGKSSPWRRSNWQQGSVGVLSPNNFTGFVMQQRWFEPCFWCFRGQRTASDSPVACLWESARTHQNSKEQRRGGWRQVFLQRRLQTQAFPDQDQPDPDERNGENCYLTAHLRGYWWLYFIMILSFFLQVEEQASTTERVFQDRQYQIDAAIVRIMKMRKTLSHNLLMSEVYNQLKFPVKVINSVLVFIFPIYQIHCNHFTIVQIRLKTFWWT